MKDYKFKDFEITIGPKGMLVTYISPEDNSLRVLEYKSRKEISIKEFVADMNDIIAERIK